MLALEKSNYIYFKAFVAKGIPVCIRYSILKDYLNLSSLDDSSLINFLNDLIKISDHENPIKDFKAIVDEAQSFDVVSERFIHPLAKVTKGSSRHLIYNKIQLKGSGRNELLSGDDELHTWGGLYFYDAIYAYLLSLYFDSCTPLGCIPYLGVNLFLPLDSQVLKNSKSLLLRPVDCYRLAQYSKEESLPEDKALMKKQVTSFHKTSDLNTIKKNIIFQHAILYLTNSLPYSLSTDNVCLDGRIIDVEALQEFEAFEGEILVAQITGEKKLFESFIETNSPEDFNAFEIRYQTAFSLFFHCFELFEALEDIFDQGPTDHEWIISNVLEVIDNLYNLHFGCSPLLLKQVPRKFKNKLDFYEQLKVQLREFYRNFCTDLKRDWATIINVENTERISLFLAEHRCKNELLSSFNKRHEKSIYSISLKYQRLLALEDEEGKCFDNIIMMSNQLNGLMNQASRVFPYVLDVETNQVKFESQSLDSLVEHLEKISNLEFNSEEWQFSIYLKNKSKKTKLNLSDLRNILALEKEFIVYEYSRRNENANFVFSSRPMFIR